MSKVVAFRSPDAKHRIRAAFDGFATQSSTFVGSPWAFIAAVVFVLLWAAFGPRYRYSDGWQLIINTVTNVAAFVIVFLIQNTQNRDASAFHKKLDQILSSVSRLDVGVNLQNLADSDLARLTVQVRREFDRRRLAGPGEKNHATLPTQAACSPIAAHHKRGGDNSGEERIFLEG